MSAPRVSIFGVGFTVMVNVVGTPVQPTLALIKLPNVVGKESTEIILVTKLVAVLITETSFEPALAT